MRVLGVDPGENNIGLAISDPGGTIANPLAVIAHVSRPVDAAAIAQIATEYGAGLIVVGQALDANDHSTVQSRRASRLARAIQDQTTTHVVMWDETGSTQAARAALIDMNVPSRKRRGHQDHLAATYILQTYLDTHMPTSGSHKTIS
jgi:putative Holliday junction resolvase